MLRRLVRIALPRALGVEALYSAFWVAGLLPTLSDRDAAAVALICARTGVSAVELVSAWLLFKNRLPGPTLARAALAASSGLVALETGWRLAPTNLDPTYRWWLVAAYWLYAGAAIWAIGRGLATSAGGRTAERAED